MTGSKADRPTVHLVEIRFGVLERVVADRFQGDAG